MPGERCVCEDFKFNGLIVFREEGGYYFTCTYGSPSPQPPSTIFDPICSDPLFNPETQWTVYLLARTEAWFFLHQRWFWNLTAKNTESASDNKDGKFLNKCYLWDGESPLLHVDWEEGEEEGEAARLQEHQHLHKHRKQRLNMELDLQRPRNSPRIWAHIRGRYWSAKKDDISL